MSTQIKVTAIPPCDICSAAGRQGVPAYADAKLSAGPWANVCREHFDLHGCSLGTGHGQELVLKERPADRNPELSFEQWMRLVDRELGQRCGFTHLDLADFAYRDLFDDECSPADVAVDVLADNGFPTDLL